MRNLLRSSVSCILLILATQISAYSLHPETPYNSTTLTNIIIHTPSQRISPNAPFNITFTLPSVSDFSNSQPLKLALHPNHDLLHQDSQIQYIDRNGVSTRTEVMKRHRHRVFKGSVLRGNEITGWTRVGWTRISILRDGGEPLFDGAFSLGSVQYHVKAEEGRITAYYDANEDIAQLSSIPMDEIDMTTMDTSPRFASQSQKRQFGLNPPNLVDTIGSIDGCPTDRRIALVGIATDCAFTATFGSQSELVDSLVSMVNTASEVFEETFNIALAVANLTVQEESDCPTSPSSASSELPWNVGCSNGIDLNWRLQQFTGWRESQGGDENAYWTLMSGCPTGSEVGVSWVGELCTEELSANVVALAQNQWQVFAHESAHTFGAYHDCESSTCSISSQSRQCCPLSSSTCSAGGQYIMNPVSSSGQREFSPCTVGNVCSAMGSGRVSTRCLTTNANTPPTITAGECGNGIIEAGEECDCGDDCDGNECCDGATCRFRGSAECDDAEGGCCSGCRFRASGEVCRAAVGECDIEETCSGDEAACPSDRFEDDGSNCGDGSDTGLFCSRGQCTNRDLQCQGMVNGDNSTISSCGNSTCVLECSSSWGDGSCARAGNVLDGTPCDGGMCRGGQCRSRTQRDNDGESWVQRNLSLVIGLSAGIGGLLLLLLVGSIAYCCCCRRRPKTVPTQAPLPPVVGYAPPPYSPRPPVPATPYYRYA
ncbi:Metallo-peptidase family M12-domain-containing protein [Aspergillus pseudoustus]|uniref:Metallo-peptidase family M12-domain-containing protein n=1 Tax=Aspergillus pseudoustus TaxID=1810923 RepID=A0ABR4JDJ6_9EURO